jgi:hypothetical protein
MKADIGRPMAVMVRFLKSVEGNPREHRISDENIRI